MLSSVVSVVNAIFSSVSSVFPYSLKVVSTPKVQGVVSLPNEQENVSPHIYHLLPGIITLPEEKEISSEIKNWMDEVISLIRGEINYEDPFGVRTKIYPVVKELIRLHKELKVINEEMKDFNLTMDLTNIETKIKKLLNLLQDPRWINYVETLSPSK